MTFWSHFESNPSRDQSYKNGFYSEQDNLQAADYPAVAEKCRSTEPLTIFEKTIQNRT